MPRAPPLITATPPPAIPRPEARPSRRRAVSPGMDASTSIASRSATVRTNPAGQVAGSPGTDGLILVEVHPVRERFGQVVRRDPRAPIEVRNRPRDLQGPIEA